jgi:hypothetical protein
MPRSVKPRVARLSASHIQQGTGFEPNIFLPEHGSVQAEARPRMQFSPGTRCAAVGGCLSPDPNVRNTSQAMPFTPRRAAFLVDGG